MGGGAGRWKGMGGGEVEGKGGRVNDDEMQVFVLDKIISSLSEARSTAISRWEVVS